MDKRRIHSRSGIGRIRNSCGNQTFESRLQCISNVDSSGNTLLTANHAPRIQNKDADDNGVKHHFRGESESLLDIPKATDTNQLSGDADNEEICQCQGAVGHYRVLKRSNDRDSCIQRISEQAVHEALAKRDAR